VRSPRQVVVVGGGVSGLAVAHFLQAGSGPEVAITLVEGGDRLGGKVLTQRVAGHPVDAGPDALLVRVPAIACLLAELGLTGAVVAPGAPGAFIWSRGRLRPLPPSTLFGVPQKIMPLLRSGLLSPGGAMRAAADLVLPRRRWPADQDVSVGALLRPRLGSQVFDRLVDPLLGGVHAGRADLLSARSVVPEIYALARAHRSIYRGTRGRPGPSSTAAPALVTLDGGLGRLVEAIVSASDRCRIELGVRVDGLSRTGDGYQVRLADGRVLPADAVVLATPAFAAAELLAQIAPAAAQAAGEVPYADVASVTLVYPREGLERDLHGTGFLVPPSEGLLLVGCSWLSAKWPHLADPAVVLVRAMVGRHGDRRFTALTDAELVERVHAELALTMGLTAAPKEATVQRWPRAMPQYTVGHQARLERIDSDLANLPGLVVTGAAYRGVGVASCVSQGERTATDLLAWLDADRTHSEGPS
jgi:protoporphyrinogen/coproporphyrinogen III oxidase